MYKSGYFENASSTLVARAIRGRSAIRQFLSERTVGQLSVWIPFSAAVTALGSITVVLAQRILQDMAPAPTATASAVQLILGLATLTVASAIGLALLRARKPAVWRLKPLASRKGEAAVTFILSATIGIFLVLGSTYLAVWQNQNHTMEWYGLRFLDKRWLLYLYWVVIFASLILPSIIHRFLVCGISEQYFAGAKASPNASARDFQTKKVASWHVILMVLLALMLAYLAFGPPWNIQRTSLRINTHEQVHLGPLQAINSGHLPNIGPASLQYGPGTQWLTFQFMNATGQFNLVGFRQAHGFLYLLGYGLFAVLASALLRPRMFVLAILLSLSVSPFAMIHWTGDGGLVVHGWPNPLRYAGAVLLLVSLPSLLLSSRRVVIRNGAATIAVGFLWGVLCWVAQENLMVGVLAGGLFAILVWTSRTVALRRILSSFFFLALGFLLALAPIAIYYTSQAKLEEYVRNYFLVGRQVINGMSNLPFFPYLLEHPITPVILIVTVPALILFGIRTLLGSSWAFLPFDMRRARLLALLLVALTCVFGAMTRTDLVHVLNTLFVYPIVLTMIYEEIPSQGSAIWTRRVRILMLLMVVLVSVSPIDARQRTQDLQGRVRRFLPGDAPQGPVTMPDSPTWNRTGFRFLPENATFRTEPDVQFAELLPVLDWLRAETEGDTVFVHSFPYADPGLVYFLADLTPPEIYLDPTSMVWSEDVRHEFIRHFEAGIDGINHIVTTTLDVSEAQICLASNNAAEIQENFLFDKSVFLLTCQPG